MSVLVTVALPAEPLQVRVYEYSPGVFRVPVLTADPEVGCVPPQEPDAVQPVDCTAVQLNRAALPAVISCGLMLNCTVTAGGTGLLLTSRVTSRLLVPPLPEQVSV